MTLTFLAITVFCLICTGCFARVIHFSTQPDQWMDSLFKWQKMIEYFGNKTGSFNTLMAKALGLCSFCFCHAITFICFWAYVLVMVNSHLWPGFETSFGQWAFNICWYMGFISFGTTLSSVIINRS